MIYRICIEGRLIGTNEYSDAQRGLYGAYRGNHEKRSAEEHIGWYIKAQLNDVHITKPVRIVIIWVEENIRRDRDNIAMARKFVQDALVRHGVLKGDGWKYVHDPVDLFTTDPERPRVEVFLIEQPACEAPKKTVKKV